MAEELSLRERKRRRTRDAIVDAAMTLFAEHGFDGVTVADIALRAEIGRTTFFRYFTDKQEVIFADDPELHRLLVAASEDAATALAPLNTLADALAVARAGLLAIVRPMARRPSTWLRLHDKLMAEHPELQARNLVKDRAYVESCVAVMLRHGADSRTAVLAASVAAGCYAAGRNWSLNDGSDLPSAVDDAFRRLTTIDGRALKARLGAQRRSPKLSG
jgi:AcrR family transcriptional regulator